jgi:cytoskeletal protein CcmA (bactofilin family)
MTIYTTTGTQFSKAGITVSYTDASGAASTQNITFANKQFSMDSGLNVTAGDVDFAGAAEIHGDAKLDSKLDVVGSAHFQNALTVDGAFNMGGSLSMAGAADLGSTLAVTGATNLKNTLVVAGAASLNNSLAVAGASNLSSTLVVAGATNLNNTLAVSGATTLAGAATINNTLLVNGAATLGAALTVTGAATLNNGVTVNGTSTHNGALVVGGAATVGGSIGVTGAATMSSSMNVKGASTLENTLGVTGAATLGSTLAVTGAATLGSSVAVAGAAAAGYNLTVTGKSKLKGDVALDSALVVASDATLQGKLDVTGAAKMASSLAVAGDAAAGYNLTVTGKSKLKGDVALDSALAVASDASLQGKLAVAGAAMMQSTLDVSGAANLNTSLAVAGPSADGYKLTVSGKTKLKNDVDISGSLVIDGSITANNNFTVNGNLTVIGTQTSLNTVNLDVTDNAILVAKGNLTDDIQSGVMVQYKPSGAAAAKYAGVKRLPGTGEFIFYKDAANPIEPNAKGGVIGEADTAGAVARALNLKNEAQASVVKLEAAEAAALTEKDWAAGKKADAAALIPAEPVAVISSPAVIGEWIQIDYGTPSLLTGFIHGSQQVSLGNVIFYGSNNSSDSFTRIGEHTYGYDSNSYTFPSPVTYRYLRIVIKSLSKTWGELPTSIRFMGFLPFLNSMKDDRLTLSSISVSNAFSTNFGQYDAAFALGTEAFTIPINESYRQYFSESGDFLFTYTGTNVAIPGLGSPEDTAAYNAAYAKWQSDNASLISAYNTAKAVYDAALATYNAKVEATAAARLQVTALQAPFAAAVAADTAYRAAAAEAAAAQAVVTEKANLRDAAAAVAAPFQAAKSQAAANVVAANAAKVAALAAIPAEPVAVLSTPDVKGEWITINYGSVKELSSVNFTWLQSNGYYNDPSGQSGRGLRNYDLYYSSNNTNWTFIKNVSNNSNGGQVLFGSILSFQYLRIVIKSLYGMIKMSWAPDNSQNITLVETDMLTTHNLPLSALQVSSGLGTPSNGVSGVIAQPLRCITIPLLNYSSNWNITSFGSSPGDMQYLDYKGNTVAISGGTPAEIAAYNAAYAAWVQAKAPLQAAYDSALAAYNAAVAADSTATSNLAPKLALLNTAAANLDAAAAIYATKNAAKMAIVNGNPTADVYATVMADSFNCASDARLKKDVVPLEGALDKIDSIRGVHYHWIDAAQPQERQVGVIAQEIQAAYPELVREGGNGFLSVDYPKLTAVLIQSVKELKAMVLALASK